MLAHTAELKLPVERLPGGTKLLWALILGFLRFFQKFRNNKFLQIKITANTVSRKNLLQSKHFLT